MAKFDPTTVKHDDKCPHCNGAGKHSRNQRDACKRRGGIPVSSAQQD
jgi:DnaJ-class molecular chaperone